MPMGEVDDESDSAPPNRRRKIATVHNAHALVAAFGSTAGMISLVAIIRRHLLFHGRSAVLLYGRSKQPKLLPKP